MIGNQSSASALFAKGQTFYAPLYRNPEMKIQQIENRFVFTFVVRRIGYLITVNHFQLRLLLLWYLFLQIFRSFGAFDPCKKELQFSETYFSLNNSVSFIKT